MRHVVPGRVARNSRIRDIPGSSISSRRYRRFHINPHNARQLTIYISYQVDELAVALERERRRARDVHDLLKGAVSSGGIELSEVGLQLDTRGTSSLNCGLRSATPADQADDVDDHTCLQHAVDVMTAVHRTCQPLFGSRYNLSLLLEWGECHYAVRYAGIHRQDFSSPCVYLVSKTRTTRTLHNERAR